MLSDVSRSFDKKPNNHQILIRLQFNVFKFLKIASINVINSTNVLANRLGNIPRD